MGRYVFCQTIGVACYNALKESFCAISFLEAINQMEEPYRDICNLKWFTGNCNLFTETRTIVALGYKSIHTCCMEQL